MEFQCGIGGCLVWHRWKKDEFSRLQVGIGGSMVEFSSLHVGIGGSMVGGVVTIQ